jgi:hypothetical protein
MTVRTILHSIGRRWYILLGGLIATAVLCSFAYVNTDVSYARSASELLVPGSQTVPEGGNPFLYLGGLTQASDVLAQALGANDLQTPLKSQYPDTSVSIARDVSTSGPIIVITVEGDKDADVAAVFDRMLAAAPTTLTALQVQANVDKAAQISLLPITIDTHSTTKDKSRLQTSALVAAGGLVVTVLLVALVDGLLLARSRNRGASRRGRDATQKDRRAAGADAVRIRPTPGGLTSRQLARTVRRRLRDEHTT